MNTLTEARALGGVWVYESHGTGGFGNDFTLLGTVHEADDDYAMDDEDTDWFCSLRILAVLEGHWPGQGRFYDGVRVRNLRRPDSREVFEVVNDLSDEVRDLLDRAGELSKQRDLLLASPVEEEQ